MARSQGERELLHRVLDLVLDREAAGQDTTFNYMSHLNTLRVTRHGEIKGKDRKEALWADFDFPDDPPLSEIENILKEELGK